MAAALVSAAALALAAAPAASAAVDAHLRNFDDAGRQVMRFDTDGNALDAHDGAIARFGHTYYLYGTSYDCGYQWQFNDRFCGFKVYSSPDLTHWTDRGFVDPARSCAFCFRPHVVYNARTRKYVMWTNSQDAPDYFRVYTADTPTGPFTEQPVPDLPDDTYCHADLDVFVDDDGTAYLACSRANWHIAVIELTPDYLRATGRSAVTGVTKVEAPAMFKRDGTYYLAMSDPNCGYCSGTGTSYLTAKHPLGPWTGRDAWTIDDGVLRAEGGNQGLSAEGGHWSDYTFSFDVAPQLAESGAFAQAGFDVRMRYPDSGYMFLLNDYKSPGRLQVLERSGGRTVTSRSIPLDEPIVAGEWHHVDVKASGTTITTWVDGALVDSFSDDSFAEGNVGFREFNGANLETALFDNVRVTDPSGAVLLQDDFSGDLSKWAAPTSGFKISDDSCGGQPAQVATLDNPGHAPTYLYFSDLWDYHTNEALANYYWQPLRFGSDGSIEPLDCGNHTVRLQTGHPGRAPRVPWLDQTSGLRDFRPSCEVTAARSLRQTFTVARTGTLTSVAVNVFQDGTEEGRVERHPPTAPLHAELVRLDPGGAARPVWATDLAPEDVGWSARRMRLRPGVRVVGGERYALELRTATPQGCYGVALSDADPYAAGAASTSDDGGLTWSARPGADLAFATVVRPGEVTR